MTTPAKSFQLRDRTALSAALFGAGHRGVYFVSISRGGRTTRWAADPAKGACMSREAWAKLMGRWPVQVKGRLVRPVKAAA